MRTVNCPRKVWGAYRLNRLVPTFAQGAELLVAARCVGGTLPPCGRRTAEDVELDNPVFRNPVPRLVPLSGAAVQKKDEKDGHHTRPAHGTFAPRQTLDAELVPVGRQMRWCIAHVATDQCALTEPGTGLDTLDHSPARADLHSRGGRSPDACIHGHPTDWQDAATAPGDRAADGSPGAQLTATARGLCFAAAHCPRTRPSLSPS